jgi:hypothetical protein
MDIVLFFVFFFSLAFLVYLYVNDDWRLVPFLFPMLAILGYLISMNLLHHRPITGVYIVLGAMELLWLLGPGRVSAFVYQEKIKLGADITILLALIDVALVALVVYRLPILASGSLWHILGVLAGALMMTGFLLWTLYINVFLTYFSRNRVPRTGRLISCGIDEGANGFTETRPRQHLCIFENDATVWSVSPRVYHRLSFHLGEWYSYTVHEGLSDKHFLRHAPHLIIR